MDKPLVVIKYKPADGKRISVEVTPTVMELLEQSDRKIRSQRRQEKRRHTEYVDGLTDTTTVLPQEDFANLISRMDSYKQLYAAIDMLSDTQQRRVRLHYFCGLSYRQIAVIEGVGYRRIGYSIEQALARLRKQLI